MADPAPLGPPRRGRPYRAPARSAQLAIMVWAVVLIVTVTMLVHGNHSWTFVFPWAAAAGCGLATVANRRAGALRAGLTWAVVQIVTGSGAVLLLIIPARA
ncbi:MAG TPA: hypothetical protein VG756_09645 [Pseudonocardiaceae bacterium]|jgi:hypothetical protein|nr:hypothetical protein [Pseudonocardiaceae bacterium]